jgi:Tfp pilus assembly protein PilO
MNMWTLMTDAEKDKIKAGLVLVVALLVGIVYYDMSIVASTIETNKAAIKRHEENLKTEQATLDMMKAQISDRPRLEARIALLEKVIAKLPKTPDPQGLFQALEGIFQITRMDILAMDTGAQRVADEYTELPYVISSRARYHDFGQFLNLIEENPKRLMRVKSFVVENDSNRPSIHPLRVTIATFMFNR